VAICIIYFGKLHREKSGNPALERKREECQSDRKTGLATRFILRSSPLCLFKPGKKHFLCVKKPEKGIIN
jgi:hypothetical protein